MNSITGEPVPRALVQVYSHSALTDSSGRFEFDDLPEMETSFMARKPGFFSQQELARGRQGSDAVHIGPDAPPVTVKLTPEAVVYGKVESGGEPIERIQVTLLQSVINEGRRYWEPHQAVTDEAGEFRIADLRPGTYVMSAGPSLDTSALTIAGPEFDVGYAQTYYSGALEFGQATPINLAAGQQAEIDFSLKKARAFKVSGTIAGNTLGQRVSLMFQDRSGRVFGFPVRFDPTGHQFYLRAPNGSYVIHAQSQDQNGVQLIADLPVSINSDRSDLALTLEPAQSIPVTVHMESSQPPNSGPQRRPKEILFGRPNAPHANVMLEATGDDLNRRTYYAYQDQGGNPQFALHAVGPGKYNLVVTSFQPWYVQSATSGSANLLTQEFEVTGSGQNIDIVLRNDSATLNVTLVAGKNRIPAAIVVVRDDAPRDIKTMGVEGNGPFPLSGLAPGGYNVLAFDQVDQLEYSNPEVLGRYLSRATHVDLEANQTRDVSLEPIQVGR